MCLSACAGRGRASLKNGSQWTRTFRTGPSGGEGCAWRRDEEDDDEEEKEEAEEGPRWLLAVRGPAGKEQPANEEPSEASIHLEHGPLQLP